jgi:hypothetical protein
MHFAVEFQARVFNFSFRYVLSIHVRNVYIINSLYMQFVCHNETTYDSHNVLYAEKFMLDVTKEN